MVALAIVATLGCTEDLVVPPAIDAAPAPEPPIAQAPPPEAAPVIVAPPIPVIDPEAEARARADAALAAFEARFPNHGITFHFLARVRARPHVTAPVVGYMRRGSRFRASARVPGVGCARGWFEVPGDGFVCRGTGFLIGSEPQSFEPSPVPAALDDALPYAYGYTARADVPQYWHIPTIAEEGAVRDVLEALASEEAREAALLEEATALAEAAAQAPEPAPVVEPESAGQTAEDTTAETAAEETTVAEPTEMIAEAGETAEAIVEAEPVIDAPPPPGESQDEGAEEIDPSLIAAARGTVEVPDFVRLRMRRGFYVSVDGEVVDSGRRFFRTIRGAYVRAEHVTSNEPPAHRGVVLGGRWQLPVAFVFRTGTHKLRRLPETGRFRDLGAIDRHTPFPIADRLTRARREYLVAREGFVVRRSSLRIAERIARPDAIEEDVHWVHVSLEEQTLVAYEGDQPVFATTVSTGREGFDTPTGLFRVQSKHVSTTMDDLNAGEESYLIEDVPWTMYFEGSFALHAAFWHHGFGRVRSHGCVNLAPADARWLFQWSGPTLPAGWHGIFADDGRAGTWIYITQ